MDEDLAPLLIHVNGTTSDHHALLTAESPQFETLFCERFGCPAEDFERRAFAHCLYPHARLLAPFIRVIRPRFFADDLAFIRYLGTTTQLSEVVEAASDFHDKGDYEKGFCFSVLKIRVSGSKTIKLARALFRQYK